MRLIYFYNRWGTADVPWTPSEPTENPYALETRGQGWLYLWQRLIEEGALDDVIYIIESTRDTGSCSLGKGVRCLVMPHIKYAREYIRLGDIICVVCGYRNWEPLVAELENEGHWLLFYRAGWHRHRWAQWHIELCDLIRDHDWYEGCTGKLQIRPRLLYALPKPIHPLWFRPLKIQTEYDICIGAATCWNKKGQWKAVRMLAAYKRLFGEVPTCIMPGAIRSDQGVTMDSFDMIARSGLPIIQTGRLQHGAMPEVFNKSSVMLHTSLGKQNDRARLEAMRCGCPLIVSSSKKHAWFTYDNPRVSLVCPELDGTDKNATGFTDKQAESMAQRVHDWLPVARQLGRRKEAFDYYEQHASVENIILPRAIGLFQWLREHPKADRNALKERWTPHGPTGQIDQNLYSKLSWQDKNR